MASIPFYKLGILTIKTLAKPISKRVQAYAQNNEHFKNLCISIGRANNRVSHYFRNVTNDGKYKIKFNKVSEKDAIETGSNLIGEGFVYAVGGGLLIEEYTRSKISKAHDERELNQRLTLISSSIKSFASSCLSLSVPLLPPAPCNSFMEIGSRLTGRASN